MQTRRMTRQHSFTAGPCIGAIGATNCATVSMTIATLYGSLSSKKGCRFRKRADWKVRAAVVLKDLRPEDFMHPLDKKNTSLLSAYPGLKEFSKIVLESEAEKIMLLEKESIGTSVLVTENQLSDLHQVLVEAANLLCVEAPDLYVRQDPVPNAHTLAIGGRKPYIVVHTSIVELLTLKELQAVIAHELGHLKCDHGIWFALADFFTLGADTVPGLGSLFEEQLFRWFRAAELTCDRAALLAVQDPKVVISMLMKMEGVWSSVANQLDVDAFLEQARSYDAASSTPTGSDLRNAQTSQSLHPLPVLRAKEIDQWATSRQYKALLARSAARQLNKST